MGFDLFISYSSKNRDAVAAIADYLERDLLVWWDRELVSGTNYEQDIFAKLADTGAVLVIWSADAAASPWVEKEAREALAQKRVVIPILLDDTPLPEYLKSIDGIVLRSWDRQSHDRELVQLARDIRLHKAAQSKPTGEAVAAGLAYAGPGTPLATVVGFFLAIAVLLSLDTTLQTLTAAAAMVAAALSISFGARRAQTAPPSSVATFAKGLATGALVVGTLSLVGLAIRTGVESRLREVGYRPDPAVLAKEGAVRAEKKQVADAIRAVRELHRAQFARELDLGEDYSGGASLCAASVGGEALKEMIGYELSSGQIEQARASARMMYAAGCLEGDWQHLGATSDANSVSAAGAVLEVPFIAGPESWSAELLEALGKGEFDAMRRELLTKAAAQDVLALHQLGVLDVLRLGTGADPNRGYLLFERAARAGHQAAEANLALCQIFGIGTYSDPHNGAELLRNVINRGLSLEASFWLLKTGTNLVREHTFSELMQRLNHERGPVAEVVLGVLASRGLSRPPCTMPCSEEVRSRIEALRRRGEASLARFLEAVLAVNRGPEAVKAAAQGLPVVMGRPTRRTSEGATMRPSPPPPPRPRPR